MHFPYFKNELKISFLPCKQNYTKFYLIRNFRYLAFASFVLKKNVYLQSSGSPQIVLFSDFFQTNWDIWIVKNKSSFFHKVGGVPLFIQQFIAEVHAIISAHVLALGGNAILSFNINEILLIDSAQKNEVNNLFLFIYRITIQKFIRNLWIVILLLSMIQMFGFSNVHSIGQMVLYEFYTFIRKENPIGPKTFSSIFSFKFQLW